ncbi:hypothetical protein ACOSQ3_014987 [Xanthoceras sorbifolium]
MGCLMVGFLGVVYYRLLWRAFYHKLAWDVSWWALLERSTIGSHGERSTMNLECLMVGSFGAVYHRLSLRAFYHKFVRNVSWRALLERSTIGSYGERFTMNLECLMVDSFGVVYHKFIERSTMSAVCFFFVCTLFTHSFEFFSLVSLPHHSFSSTYF